MITDYHVHLETGPYTIEWVLKYLEVAKNRNISDLGFSEHGYRFKQSKSMLFNPWIEERQTENIEEYVTLILKAKKQGLPVKLGIELDYIPNKEKEIENFLKDYPWDYVIGSVHWIDNWGFDLQEMKNNWENKAVINVYKEYFNIIKNLLAFKQFDILGHVDVIKVLGHKPKESENEILFNMYDKLVNQIKESNITVEVNTAGLRKPVLELYPSPQLMKRLTENNIPLILNSDAHQPKHVGEDYDIAINYFRKYNVDKISTFDQRKRTIVDLG